MKTQIVDGIKYKLVPTQTIGGDNCIGCDFSGTSCCTIKTGCCDHIEKYGKNYIYKRLKTPTKDVVDVTKRSQKVWILKDKETGKFNDIVDSRDYARMIRKGDETIVKGILTEV